MTGRMAGKRALVTGAAQGLGAATARLFAEQGAHVLLTDLDGAKAEATARAIAADCGDGCASAIRHDVTAPEEWQAALAAAQDRMGGLSVLVNNAGVGLSGSIADCTLADWRRTFAINVDAIFIGCQAALPMLADSQPAAIVNISSIAAMIASPAMPAYNASKAAVTMLSKSIALYCAEAGWDLRCNTLHPAFVDTAILDGFVREGASRAAVVGKLARQIPLGRVGEPIEVAQAVVYLASDESRFMTGSELKIDGGISAQ